MADLNKLPESFLNNMKLLLGQEYDEYLTSYNESTMSGLRINTLKTKVDSLPIGFENLENIPWIPNGYFISDDSNYSKHPYYYAGLYYLQEPSAMTPASLLGTQPGDRVLDICAAPGGKSTQIGADLEGKGVLVSNDISASRAKALLKNIELLGIGNSYITAEEPGKLSEVFPEYFDRILIDAPCSGEGMFRKSPSVINYYMDRGPAYYAEIQKDLLEKASVMLKPGGILMYSTCTFNEIEDEDAILGFMSRHENFEIEYLPIKEGFTSSGKLPGTIRLFPHKIKGEGHFLVKLKKAGSYTENLNTFNSIKIKNTVPSEAIEFLNKIKRNWNYDRIFQNGDLLFYLPEGTINIKRLRYLRTGLFLGTIKKSRFEPSQALAMNIKADEWDNPIDFKLSDQRIIRYLKGETIDADDEYKGYRLVCVSGFPLGFVKQDGYRCKNKYNPGWRWM